MKKKTKWFLLCIIILVSCLLLEACLSVNKNQNKESDRVEEETTMKEVSVIEANKKMFVDKLNVKENPAKGAAERLSEIGCGRIVDITNLDKSGGAYSMNLTDEKGDVYDITMSYEGYLGVVKDENGNYLLMPVD